MLAMVKSTALNGLNGQLVQVEVDVSGGLPSFDLVGLPDTAVREARDRVRAAIKNSGYDFPIKRITVNLAPADIKKEGPLYDLPIAAGILAATEQIDASLLEKYIILGELSLNGAVRGITGALPNVITAWESGFSHVIVPQDNAEEAALVQGAMVFPVHNLAQFVRFIQGEEVIAPHQVDIDVLLTGTGEAYADLAEVRGQHGARRALEVAAAGGHNVLMVGSPGSGKTMLARRMPGILPDLTPEEALETTKVHSLAAQLRPGQPMVVRRPFRSPHHSASAVALVGGGRIPKPGEISLANHGILFMDEMPEFHKDALEALRQPLEDGIVTISRVNSTVSYPARLMLIGAMNPCPCGFYGDPVRECTCTPYQIQRYISRISGPLLDRMDIHIEVPRMDYSEISHVEPGESSAEVKGRVVNARLRQLERFNGGEPFSNARMDSAKVRKFCLLSKEAGSLLKAAYKQLNMSARAHDRILKVARTIADLEGADLIEAVHVAEAVQYRSLENKYWL